MTDLYFRRPKIGAEIADADRYEILEQTFRTATDEILTLLLIRAEEMLEEWGARRPLFARKK